MKKTIKILSLAGFLTITSLIFAQPPDPNGNPNTDGNAQELGGSAPIGSGMILLSILGGLYAVGRTYTLKSRKKYKE